MREITCPACGIRYAEWETACPQCGHPRPASVDVEPEPRRRRRRFDPEYGDPDAYDEYGDPEDDEDEEAGMW